ncbi:MAG: serine protease Do [Alteromonas naphthalenivorans]|jgi:serine protease Do
MNMRFVKQVLILSVVFIMGSLLYVGYENQKELAQSVATMSAMLKQDFKPKSEVKIIEKMVSAQPWGHVQTKAKDTVVQIIAQTAEVNLLKPYETPRQGGGFGSGFFISDTGEIITNMHVIDQAQSVWIKIPSMGKAIIPAEVIGKAPERDLALLKITDQGKEIIKRELNIEKFSFLKLGDSDLVSRADEVLALGYPLGQASLKSTSGVVSGREHLGGKHLIQISSPINPGSSGGPVLDLNGDVIGIAVAGVVSAQNVGYIIPVNELTLVLNGLRTKKLLRRPFLGVLVGNGSYDLAKHLGNPVPSGCYVIDVHPNGPLAKSGVKGGDMIYEVNGLPIDEYGDLKVPWSEEKLSFMDYIARWEEGKDITLLIYRDGKRKDSKFKFNYIDNAPVKKVIVGEDSLDYEIFGGMLFQPLNLNLVQTLISNAPSLIKYAEFKNQMDPALIVTHVMPSSLVDRMVVIQPGAIIDEVNGTKVTNMKELRSELKKSVKKKRVVFKTSDGAVFVINSKAALSDEQRLSKTYHYPLSEFIQELRKSLEKIDK